MHFVTSSTSFTPSISTVAPLSTVDLVWCLHDWFSGALARLQCHYPSSQPSEALRELQDNAHDGSCNPSGICETPLLPSWERSLACFHAVDSLRRSVPHPSPMVDSAENSGDPGWARHAGKYMYLQDQTPLSQRRRRTEQQPICFLLHPISDNSQLGKPDPIA